MLDPAPSLSALFTNIAQILLASLTFNSQQVVQKISHPDSYEEEALNLAWQVFMTQEFEALHANQT